MTGPRRAAAIVVLLLLGWAMVALAAVLRAWWPLFVAALPYAAVPWIIVRAEREAR
ncbi:MAG: hypothetical protein KatS3mg014_0236 [Actinomycetota bacterium]|nr:MAG: hypothetical protein KatS3mg014_0236 [Actinomycetota bacterium]